MPHTGQPSGITAKHCVARRMVSAFSNNACLVQELEDKILRLLKEAKGNILDDEVLINTLNNSKLTAGMIQNRVQEAEETENNINQVCVSLT